MVPLEAKHVRVQNIDAKWLSAKNLHLDVLRLDELHPVASGNKLFKLRYYLQDAVQHKATTIATFGGVWSNHLVATAYACRSHNLKSIGFVRGETENTLTLQQAQQFGMQLHFFSREAYRNKFGIMAEYTNENWYWIGEGGYGMLGAKGAAEILAVTNTASYTHIIAAVGTGTMLAGLRIAALPSQHVIGISAMKGNQSLKNQVDELLPESITNSDVLILHDYHFGGFGKHPHLLIDFINTIYKQHQLPLDIVYTGKAFYAVEDLVLKGFIPASSKVLLIHSGGLQGNRSLSPGRLGFT